MYTKSSMTQASVGGGNLLAVHAFLPHGSGEGEDGSGAVGVQCRHSSGRTVEKKKQANCFNRS